MSRVVGHLPRASAYAREPQAGKMPFIAGYHPHKWRFSNRLGFPSAYAGGRWPTTLLMLLRGWPVLKALGLLTARGSGGLVRTYTRGGGIKGVEFVKGGRPTIVVLTPPSALAASSRTNNWYPARAGKSRFRRLWRRWGDSGVGKTPFMRMKIRK